MKKTYRIKTNNQELLIRKQNESDATSRWIEFQKTRPKGWIPEKLIELIDKKSQRYTDYSMSFSIPFIPWIVACRRLQLGR